MTLGRLHRAALAFAQRGFPVFPLLPRKKEPVTKHGFLDATTNPTVIDSWWEGWPQQNVAVRTGGVPRLVIVDVDGDNGEASMEALQSKHGKLPATVEAISGRAGGGRHLYFRAKGEFPCTTGLFGKGIDTKGDGGYIVAPCSIHPTGKEYAWSVDSAGAIADLPEFFYARVQDKALRRKTPQQWHSMLGDIIQSGERNSTLTSIAGKLLLCGDVVFAAGILHCVNEARCDPPLPRDEVDGILVSIGARHAAKAVRK